MLKVSTQLINQISTRLKDLGATLSCAESCTGGMLGALLTQEPGASSWFQGGVISYSNDIKTGLLGVEAPLIAEHSAVSESCAKSMANGARKVLKSTYALSITGYAGPEEEAQKAREGRVFIGFASPSQVVAYFYHFSGSRSEIRESACNAALDLLSRNLMGN